MIFDQSNSLLGLEFEAWGKVDLQASLLHHTACLISFCILCVPDEHQGTAATGQICQWHQMVDPSPFFWPQTNEFYNGEVQLFKELHLESPRDIPSRISFKKQATFWESCASSPLQTAGSELFFMDASFRLVTSLPLSVLKLTSHFHP